MHNENLHDLHCSKSFMTAIIARRSRVARFGKKRPACRVLKDKPEEKKQLANTGHRIEHSYTRIKEIGWEDVVRIHRNQDRDKQQHAVKMLAKLRVL